MPANQILTWTDPALEPVDYLSADYRDFAFPPHLHDGYGIGVIERGAQCFRSGQHSPVLMPKGTLPGRTGRARRAHGGGKRRD